MTRVTFQRLGFRLYRDLLLLGWAGGGGVLLLLLSLTYVFTVLQPMQSRELALRQDAMSLRVQMDARRGKTTEHDETGQLGEFYQYFPVANGPTEMLEKIYLAAADEGLALDQGEYRKIDEPAMRLARYDMAFPLGSVSYAKLRRFLSRVLRENPALAIESLTLTRPAVGGATVDVQLRLTWYFRPSSP